MSILGWRWYALGCSGSYVLNHLVFLGAIRSVHFAFTTHRQVSERRLVLKMFLRNIYDMDVSENSGTPKSSILIGFSIIFTIHFVGPPLFLETPTSFFCQQFCSQDLQWILALFFASFLDASEAWNEPAEMIFNRWLVGCPCVWHENLPNRNSTIYIYMIYILMLLNTRVNLYRFFGGWCRPVDGTRNPGFTHQLRER